MRHLSPISRTNHTAAHSARAAAVLATGLATLATALAGTPAVAAPGRGVVERDRLADRPHDGLAALRQLRGSSEEPRAHP